MRVARLRSQDPRVLTDLAALGVTPGAMLRIVTNDPEAEEIRVDVDGKARRLPCELAAVVRGERVS